MASDFVLSGKRLALIFYIFLVNVYFAGKRIDESSIKMILRILIVLLLSKFSIRKYGLNG